MSPSLVVAALVFLGPQASLVVSSDPEDVEQRIIHAAEKVRKATVALSLGGEALACGIVVTDDGWVITHGHHGKPVNTILNLAFADGRRAEARIVSVANFLNADASVLKIERGGSRPFVEMATVAQLEATEDVLFLGRPLGRDPALPAVLRRGRVLQHFRGQLHTTVPIVPGDSGGPLFDLDGRVLGVANASRLGRDASSIFTGVEFFRTQWKRLTYTYGEAPTAWQRLPEVGPAPACENPGYAAVTIMSGERVIGLGTQLTPTNLVVTKLSELTDNAMVRPSDGIARATEVVARFPAHDVAFLRAADLPPLVGECRTADQLISGRLVFTLGAGPCTLDRGVLATDRVYSVPALTDEDHAMQEVEGELSGRRSEFVSVFAHDALVAPDECGSPVVDRWGQLLGVNIARSRRFEMVAIPIATILELQASISR